MKFIGGVELRAKSKKGTVIVNGEYDNHTGMLINALATNIKALILYGDA
jgi:hypothetical protein